MDDHEAVGTLRVLRTVECVDGAAWLVQITAGGLRLIGILEVVPDAAQCVEVNRPGVKMLGQRCSGLEPCADNPNTVLGIQEQGVDIDSRQCVANQRLVLGVQSQQQVLVSDDFG